MCGHMSLQQGPSAAAAAVAAGVAHLMAEMAMGVWPSAQKSAACSSAFCTFSHLFTASTTCSSGSLKVVPSSADTSQTSNGA